MKIVQLTVLVAMNDSETLPKDTALEILRQGTENADVCIWDTTMQVTDIIDVEHPDFDNSDDSLITEQLQMKYDAWIAKANEAFKQILEDLS